MSTTDRGQAPGVYGQLDGARGGGSGGRSAGGRHPDQASGQPGAACAPLGEQTLPLTACFRFITGRVVEYGMSDQHLEKRSPNSVHKHTHTHSHGGAYVPSFEIKHTHTHTHTHRRGRQAGEMRRRGPNTIRRGEAGVESNHSRGRPLPAQNHKEVETRERERQHARLWASKRCRSPLVSVLSPASSSNTESPIASIPNQDHKRTTTLTLL